MKQVLIIHGGSSFDSYHRYLDSLKSSTIDYERLKKAQKWRESLVDELQDYDVLLPTFPNSANAVYEEWKIYFEKLLPLLVGEKVILVGYSLGGMFLAKYLNEFPLAKPVDKVILIAPCYDDESIEDLGSFTVVSSINLPKSAREVHLFHSNDDPVSPFTELGKFQRDMPSAFSHTFVDRNHFFQPTFPELRDIIKK
ncbi:MAG: alpha/beta fold hydrolase [Candidatus Saccharimonas sp.]